VSGSQRDSAGVAWRIYDNLNDWTARVDTKASIVLAVEAASLALVVGLGGEGSALDPGSGLARWSLGIGVLLLCCGVVFAGLVVLPQLRGWRLSRESKKNFVYFGHIRSWDPDALAKAIGSDPDMLDQVSRQVVIMSKIVWLKHIWLQWSLYSLIAALFFVVPVYFLGLVGGAT
jgi:hypothetical protein